MRIVLASTSPRRRELLEREGLAFEVMASPAEELHDETIPLAELCERNAELKALAVEVPDAAVIGADTLVWIEGVPLGKPKDLDGARAMLKRLSGQAHTVCTGVCVVFPGGKVERFHELTDVRFRAFDEEVIEDYFSKVNPLDKAGAYGIQEHGEMLVDGIEGSFDNVMGLPVALLMERLEACGNASR
jgi:septum formation protein